MGEIGAKWDLRVMSAAKQFLMSYFSDGRIRQPEHFDRDILGVDSLPAVIEILRGREPVWNKTIFCDALGELIEENKITVWQDEEGFKYQYDPIIKLS